MVADAYKSASGRTGAVMCQAAGTGVMAWFGFASLGESRAGIKAGVRLTMACMATSLTVGG